MCENVGTDGAGTISCVKEWCQVRLSPHYPRITPHRDFRGPESAGDVEPAISVEVADNVGRGERLRRGDCGELIRSVSIEDLARGDNVRMAVAVHIGHDERADGRRLRRDRGRSISILGETRYQFEIAGRTCLLRLRYFASNLLKNLAPEC
jgi:hypothetical protein